MDIVDQELIAEFVVESQEGLANVENQMLAIEAAGAEIDTELVNGVFRTMHSIKGSAGFLGLDRIETLAHSLEEVLNSLRNKEIVPTSELITTVLKAADYVKGLIDAVDSSHDADVDPYVAELQTFRPGATASSTLSPATTVESPDHDDNAAELPESPAAEVAGSLGEAVREYLVECHENLDQMDQQLLVLEETPAAEQPLRIIFRTMHTLKGGAGFLGLKKLEQLAHVSESLLGQLRDGHRSLTSDTANALLATVDKCREGLRLVEWHGNDDALDVEELLSQLRQLNEGEAQPAAPEALPATDLAAVETPASQPSSSTASPEPQPMPAAATATPATPESSSNDKPAPNLGDSTIRVDVALLDKLMTRVGELVLARNQILQCTTDLDDANFLSTAQRLNLITTELQEGVMKTRMQPIGNVWAKFPRVVRDLAKQLNKQVHIEMEGKETELDKTIIEAIKDPLTHLVRNAVDHGIETSEIRQQAGKPAEGHLCLRAYHEGGQVNIEISDDGAGLNLERIRQKAVERGLVSADHASRLSDREASQLILLPGFSTAQEVTSVSGRGVGMDVVKTNIERIGGMLDLQSQPGQGTTVRIKIPLTLAIIPALVITNDGDRYAIPQASLLELVRLEGEQALRGIEYVHEAPVYRLRGKLLPLVNLSDQLGLTPSGSSHHPEEADSSDKVINIVVLRANDREFGLVVDKVNDTEEIVVKPLSRQLKSLTEYAGATIMGDGTVALILDVMGLAVTSGLAGEMRDQSLTGATTGETRSTEETHSLVIVDIGDERRFALQTSTISRLEKTPRTSIEYADGREVIQYRGAIMPLVRLQSVFGPPAVPPPESEELQLVVYSEDNQSYGLVVHRIVDAVETELTFQTQKSADDHLIGTAVIQERVTDVLNVRNLARHAAHAEHRFLAKV